MINSKYTSLSSSLTAVLTLAFASGVKAAVISPPPIPTVTASTFTTEDSQNNEPFTLMDGAGDAYAASFIGGTINGLNKGIYVNGVDANNPDLSTIYNVCFEYGLYIDIFNSNRTGINAPCVNVINLTTPEFFKTNMGQPDAALANLAAGVIDPMNAMPPGTPIRSNGLLTALNATLTDGDSQNDVKRVLGQFVDTGGVILSGGTTGTIDFYIPYGFDPNNANSVLTTSVTFDPNTGLWYKSTGGTGVSADNQAYMFARFGPTGDTVDVHTPTDLELPEPSAIGGLLLVGAALWLTNRRR